MCGHTLSKCSRCGFGQKSVQTKGLKTRKYVTQKKFSLFYKITETRN